MTRRRRWLMAVAGAVGLVVLALPPVHWRLYGWARGEQFYKGRPASYWSAEIAACDATLFLECFTETPTLRMLLTRRPNSVDRARQWLADRLSWPDLAPNSRWAPNNRWRLNDDDPTALPVLIALLDEPPPQVRYFAAQCIAGLHDAGRPALTTLRAHVRDQAAVVPGSSVTVANAASHAIWMLEADALRKPDKSMEAVLLDLLRERGIPTADPDAPDEP
jgi:hypothetical protein